MRNIAPLMLLFFVLSVSCNSSNKPNAVVKDSVVHKEHKVLKTDNELDEVILAFVKAYSTKDDSAANALINSELGISIIHRPGVSDVFTKMENLIFSKPIPSQWVYGDIDNSYELKYESLPEFDCGTDKWNKLGLYCDTLSRPNQLTQIIDFENEFEKGKYNKVFRDSVYKEELSSYRVILTGKEPLIFHVRRYNGSWCIVLLDRAYAGCDA